MQKSAIIIGAGPAGLTAALELLRRTNIKPIVLESGNQVGGISRTVRYKGNCMDIGGHRFFSKSDRVMNWWLDLMPMDAAADANAVIAYQNQTRPLPHSHAAAPSSDLVMLLRPRKSRIYYLRRFFDYPIKLSLQTLTNLGLLRTARIGLSYLASRVNKVHPEKSLEDFFINRFGRQFYQTFFKSYTEKVWGASCSEISAEWGAQRIKGLSLTSALKHFLRESFSRNRSLSQKNVDTSLIERFLYPKFGAGQMWEHVASLVLQMGGEIHLNRQVEHVHVEAGKIISVTAASTTDDSQTYFGDYFFSTMPIKDLIRAMDVTPPANVCEVSEGLQYRDFITVGILAEKLRVSEPRGGSLRDTWIYIQEPDVQLGRLQIFNNWSPYMVADPTKVWIGLEYFCNESDGLWQMQDDALMRFAASELEKIGILRIADMLDGHVVRVPKTYPAYFGTYGRFNELRNYMNGFENLFLVGRNGMHKYNNQDHSMLTAMTAVDNILAGITDKNNLWEINTEQEYHEHKPNENGAS